MELICLGDSLTFGYGVRPQERWLHLAARETGWRIVNRGVSGDTTGGMLARLREVLEARPAPDRVLLMGGANDIFYSGSDRAARANMGAMLHQLLSAGLRPAAGIPMPIAQSGYPERWGAAVDFPGAAALLDAYDRWLEAYCGAFGIPTVDFRGDFVSADGRPRGELYLDGLHPNPAGHRLMAARLARFLRTIEA